MKITISRLRSLIRESLLAEAQCPSCGTDGAYIGFNSVECSNPKCRNFSQRQADETNPAAKPVKSNVLRFGFSDLADGFPDAARAFSEQITIDYPDDVVFERDGDTGEMSFDYEGARYLWNDEYQVWDMQ